MNLNDRFRAINPLQTLFPPTVFASMPALASRARAFIPGRTREQVEWVALLIASLLTDHVTRMKQAFVESVLRGGHSLLDRLDADKRTHAAVAACLDAWPFDEPNPFHAALAGVSRSSALRQQIHRFQLSDAEHFPGGTPQEVFAVLALMEIDEAMRTLYRRPPGPMHSPGIVGSLLKISPDGFLESDEQCFSLAADSLMAASEALAWAEASESPRFSLADQERLVLEGLERSAEKRAKRKQSELAKRAAHARHRETRQMKTEIREWFIANQNLYPSLDKTAEAIVMRERLVALSFRTVRDWLTEFSKELRSARTP